MNKKGDVAVTLLVFMVLALFIATLIVLTKNKKEQADDIEKVLVLDELNVNEEELDFYINLIVEKILSENKNIDVSMFRQLFKQELEQYRDKSGLFINNEISQVYWSLDNIRIENNILKMEFDISSKESFWKDSYLDIDAKRDYKKEYEFSL